MLLRSLFLQNFRNYPKSELTFSPKTTLIVGPNTSGKTNLLEAIYLLAQGKSFRARLEREMISWGEEVGRVKGIRNQESGISLEIILTTGFVQNQKASLKKHLVNGVSRRQMDFLGNLRCVYFGPEDLQLVTDSPALRREYLDAVLEQIDRSYRRANLVYTKALRARNKLLVKKREEGSVSQDEMDYWNRLLLENGPQITQKREEFIDFLNTQRRGRKIIYAKSVISPERLAQYTHEEMAAGLTLVGPQRDDFFIEQDGRNLAVYGSRGEQRLAVLELKLGELEFIAQKCDERPLLLLDDIFSELDHPNRQYVLEVIPQQQTIITTTDLHLIPESYQKEAEVIELGENERKAYLL